MSEATPITLANYEVMAECHGGPFGKAWATQGGWPYLSRNPDHLGTCHNEYDWELYFRDHLGGFPPSYQLFRDGVIPYFNLPEQLPQDFDASYSPPPLAFLPRPSRPLLPEVRCAARALPRALWPDGHLANCFVPKDTEAYKRMRTIIDSGEVPAVSRKFEIGSSGPLTMRECVRETPAGVFVPLLWLR